MPTVDQEIRDGREAESILSHPLINKAFSAIESNLIDRMKQVAMADIDTQHELVLSLQLLVNLKKQFETVVQTGKMAAIQKDSLTDKLRRITR